MTFMKKCIVFLVAFIAVFGLLQANAQNQYWQWAKGGGASHNDESHQVATLPDGSIVIGGYYCGPTFTYESHILTNPGSFSPTNSRFFLARLDANGYVMWIQQNLHNDAKIYDVHTDEAGNIYVTGNYKDQISIDSTMLSSNSGTNAFFAKFDSTGDLKWVSTAYHAGFGIGSVHGTNIITDKDGNIYLEGFYNGAGVVFLPSLLQLSNTSNITQVFLAKFDSTGNILWARQSTSQCGIYGGNLGVDTLGNVYLSGWFFNGDLVFTPFTVPNYGSYDCFIVKFDSVGTTVWVKSIGAAGYDVDCYLAVDRAGNVYAGGAFGSPSITIDSFTLVNSSVGDGFLCKLDPDGIAIWAQTIYGNRGEAVSELVVTDDDEDLLITGSFTSSILLMNNAVAFNPDSMSNIFIAKLDSSGYGEWAISSYNSIGHNKSFGLACNDSGDVYITGWMFYSPNFVIGPFQMGSYGDSEMFVAKIGDSPASSDEEETINPFINFHAYPVPAKESCKVSFKLGSTSDVSLTIQDITGRKLSTLIDDNQMSSGIHEITISGYAPGIYILSIFVDEEQYSKKIVIR